MEHVSLKYTIAYLHAHYPQVAVTAALTPAPKVSRVRFGTADSEPSDLVGVVSVACLSQATSSCIMCPGLPAGTKPDGHAHCSNGFGQYEVQRKPSGQR